MTAPFAIGPESPMREVLISAPDLARWVQADPSVRLLDVRSREEFDSVRIEGSILLSLAVMQEILTESAKDRPLVIIDHQGKQALDTATFFLRHGLKQVRCLRGGIDAWSREVDPKLPRYQIELEDTGPGHATLS
jgi:rhodanese-related sulfurtransferase